MTEIKTITKVALLAYGIVNLLFGFMMIFLLDEILTPMTGWTNPLHPRVAGGFLLIIGFFAFLMLLNKGGEWEHIKLTYIAMYLFILPVLIGQLLAIALIPISAAFVNELIFEAILETLLLVLGIIGYMKQRG